MWEYIIGIGILAFIVAMYILTYRLNEKTEKPEGCEDIECSSCKDSNCSHRK